MIKRPLQIPTDLSLGLLMTRLGFHAKNWINKKLWRCAKMKILAFLILAGLNTQAGTLSLFCGENVILESCGRKIEVALRNLGCIIDSSETKCYYSLDENSNQTNQPYCDVTSANCSSPLSGNFGRENCFDREKVKIPKLEGIHNGYWFGFGPYSRTVCRAK